MFTEIMSKALDNASHLSLHSSICLKTKILNCHGHHSEESAKRREELTQNFLLSSIRKKLGISHGTIDLSRNNVVVRAAVSADVLLLRVASNIGP